MSSYNYTVCLAFEPCFMELILDTVMLSRATEPTFVRSSLILESPKAFEDLVSLVDFKPPVGSEHLVFFRRDCYYTEEDPEATRFLLACFLGELARVFLTVFFCFDARAFLLIGVSLLEAVFTDSWGLSVSWSCSLRSSMLQKSSSKPERPPKKLLFERTTFD